MRRSSGRVVECSLLSLSILFWSVSASAFQCPKLIRELEALTEHRSDEAAKAAKGKAVDAANLHAQGKHEEAVARAKQGLALVGAKPLK